MASTHPLTVTSTVAPLSQIEAKPLTRLKAVKDSLSIFFSSIAVRLRSPKRAKAVVPLVPSEPQVSRSMRHDY